MQQQNFSLLDLVFQEQQIQKEIPNKCSIQETSKFITYNPLGFCLFLEANCNKENIDKLLFSQILKMIEDKLLEFEERLDNRDQIKNINQQLNLLKPPDPYFKSKPIDDTQSEQVQQRKFSQQSDIEITSPQTNQAQDQKSIKSQKSQRSRSQMGRTHTEITQLDPKLKANEEGLIAKIQLFDKKLKQVIEQVNKLSQKDDQFQRRIEMQVQSQLKDSQDRLIQNDKVFKQYQQTNQEIIENQRGYLNRISQLRQEMDYLQQELSRIQEDNKLPLLQVQESIQELQKQVNQQQNELIVFKTILESIDNDFLALLKKFKDIQNDLAKKKLNSSMAIHQYLK
ncbi:unnamed protein product [Paramecium sonneborni]|uniref:Uncharacterized protein n=1 Tax=Paramecium sonneborni TaxID=65129 RepID=A0A8S1LCH3_9CILI|nr:unnamed protein product [Paramecium sonneborni]